MTEFPSVQHVALTVTDLEASREWYTRLLGAEAVLDEPVPPLDGHRRGFHHVVFALPGGVLFALHAHGATDRSQLFDELGVKHGGIAEDANGYGLSFRDPDNIALELWSPRS